MPAHSPVRLACFTAPVESGHVACTRGSFAGHSNALMLHKCINCLVGVAINVTFVRIFFIFGNQFFILLTVGVKWYPLENPMHSKLKPMKTTTRIISCLLAVSALGACGSMSGQGGNGGSGNGPAEKWHNFDQKQPQSADKNWGNVVVLREGRVVPGSSINIFVNGEYLASLLPGSFKQSIACAGANRLTARYTDVSSKYLEKEREGQYFTVDSGKMIYLKVSGLSPEGVPQLRQIDEAEARKLLPDLKEQVHTLARVDNRNSCGNPAQKKAYSLQAAALFGLDKSDYNHMNPQGKQEVRNIAKDIAQQKTALTKIEVIGHTDPEGNPAHNQTLSEARAVTVKRVMVESGLPAELIHTSGKGSQQLVVKDCRAKFPQSSAQRSDCNLPNRRVEILVYGTSGKK